MRVLPALCDQLIDNRRNNALVNIGAVIRRNVQIPGDSPHLVLIENEPLRTGSDDDIRRNAVLMQPFDLRIDRCRSDAAADKQEFLAVKLFLAHGQNV